MKSSSSDGKIADEGPAWMWRNPLPRLPDRSGVRLWVDPNECVLVAQPRLASKEATQV
jgi:hypothetical protein